MAKLSWAESLRRAIKQSGKSYNAIAREAKVAPIQISRFVSGERPDLRLSTAERLAGVVGLELRPKRK